MGFSSKAKNESWGLGLLLIFFPDDDNGDDKYENKKKRLSSSFSSLKSRCSNGNLIISKAQSTISICALIVFLTLLLFTLSTFEPTLPTPNSLSTTKIYSKISRRYLAQNPQTLKDSSPPVNGAWFLNTWRKGVKYKNPKNRYYKSNHPSSSSSSSSSSIALQGMGSVFRRGTKAMNDLLVAHLMEDTTIDDLRLFIRSLHRSGLTAKSDVVFLFPSSSTNLSSNFSSIIQEENESFLKLVHHYRKKNSDSSSKSVTSFDVTQFVDKKKEKQRGEPLWGRKIQSGIGEDKSPELNWGSVVSFEATELDSEGSLTGFLDNVPMSLRRWACYPMLLGRVRRNFKHLLLVDVKDVVVLGDSVARVRNRSPESVILSTIETIHGKHHRKNSEKTQTHINPSVIMGGMRGIRRLSNAMLIEIVRTAIHGKNKTPISESVVFNKLVQNDSLLKTVNIITTTESIPDTSSLASQNWSSSSSSSSLMVHRGNSNLNLNSLLHKEICSSPLDSYVYSDC